MDSNPDRFLDLLHKLKEEKKRVYLTTDSGASYAKARIAHIGPDYLVMERKVKGRVRRFVIAEQVVYVGLP